MALALPEGARVIGSSVFTVGLYVAPLVLLALGHGLRRRSARARGAFWGAVIGYGLGAIITSVITVLPPYYWGGGSALRELVVHWSLVVPTAVGSLVGALKARDPVAT
jgi:hypothetical protein